MGEIFCRHFIISWSDIVMVESVTKKRNERYCLSQQELRCNRSKVAHNIAAIASTTVYHQFFVNTKLESFHLMFFETVGTYIYNVTFFQLQIKIPHLLDQCSSKPYSCVMRSTCWLTWFSECKKVVDRNGLLYAFLCRKNK